MSDLIPNVLRRNALDSLSIWMDRAMKAERQLATLQARNAELERVVGELAAILKEEEHAGICETPPSAVRAALAAAAKVLEAKP